MLKTLYKCTYGAIYESSYFAKYTELYVHFVPQKR